MPDEEPSSEELFRLRQLQARVRRDTATRNATILMGVAVGTIVHVQLDSKEVVFRELLSQPWRLGSGDWVAKVRGISGGYCCSRITVPA